MNKKLEKLNEYEINFIKLFLSKLKLNKNIIEKYTRGLWGLSIEGGTHKDIFKPKFNLIKFIEKYNMIPYSLGLYIGLIGRRGFEPSLPLAHELAPFCKSHNIKCVILNIFEEKKFLYGKTIILQNRENVPMGYVLVVNRFYEALGWAIIKRPNNKYWMQNRLLRPVRDLGWYLRKGG